MCVSGNYSNQLDIQEKRTKVQVKSHVFGLIKIRPSKTYRSKGHGDNLMLTDSWFHQVLARTGKCSMFSIMRLQYDL